MERGAHSGGEGIDGRECSTDNDSLGCQEGHEMGDAMAQEGARLADGRRNFGDTVACCGQKLCVVLIDEACCGQVCSDRVGGRDRFEASDVAALAGAARGGLDGDVRDIPGQSALTHLRHTVDEVGAADGGASLDVDKRVDGGHAVETTPVDGFADGSRARVVFDEGGQSALLGDGLGDVDAVPPGHAGGADHARALRVHGTRDRQGNATDPHAGSFFLARYLVHDSVEHLLRTFRDVNKETRGLPDSSGGVRQGDEAVVGSQLDESECSGSVGGDEAARAPPARGNRVFRFRDDSGFDEARHSGRHR